MPPLYLWDLGPHSVQDTLSQKEPASGHKDQGKNGHRNGYGSHWGAGE